METTTDIHSILTDDTIKLVDVCLPTNVHKEYVINALKHGKDVFCETPIAHTLEDARAMLETADELGQRLWINQFIKREAPYQVLANAYEDNLYGKLKLLHIQRLTPPLWGDLSLKTLSTDLMIHDCDVVSGLLGVPKRVTSIGASHLQGQSQLYGLLQYPDTLVHMEGASMMPFGFPFRVGFKAVFEEATLEYQEDGFRDEVVEWFKRYSDGRCEDVVYTKGNCLEETLKEVVNLCLSERQASNLDAAYAVASLELALTLKEQVIGLKNQKRCCASGFPFIVDLLLPSQQSLLYVLLDVSRLLLHLQPCCPLGQL